VVSPTAIVLDSSDTEIARHEGEEPNTFAAIRADSDDLLQEGH